MYLLGLAQLESLRLSKPPPRPFSTEPIPNLPNLAEPLPNLPNLIPNLPNLIPNLPNLSRPKP